MTRQKGSSSHNQRLHEGLGTIVRREQVVMSGTKPLPLNRVTADQRIFPSSSAFKASAVPIESLGGRSVGEE